MSSNITFFPKIARLSREVVITEKLDGTNAGVRIDAIINDPVTGVELNLNQGIEILRDDKPYLVRALSKNRVLVPACISGKKDTDNFGFAAWVMENAADLVKLGEGTHFGEWWGRGIQRGYGLDHKRFSLFNVGLWALGVASPPACCHVVPVIGVGMFSDTLVLEAMDSLALDGSRAAPGFKNPEGIIVYHTAAKTMFKKTFEADTAGKEAA